VEAEAGGFKKAVSTQFVLEVSREIRMDLKLQPAALTETVQVSAEGALADTTDTTLKGVLSNKAISELQYLPRPQLHQLGYVVIEDVEAARADQAATSRRGV
jgi:hypothetical protein